VAVPKWLRGRPPSPTAHLVAGFCCLAFGVFWLTIGATGGSFQVWHLGLGGGWLTLAVGRFISAAIRKKKLRQGSTPWAG
jgi:thiosulfate reductase cytochrome b subunit